MSKTKWIRGATASIATTPVVDGQLLLDYTKNTLNADVKVGNETTRRQIGGDPSAIDISYVRGLFADDDIVTEPTYSDFPVTGTTGKIYVDLSTGNTYKWENGEYVEFDAGNNSPTSFGFGFGRCDTAEATLAKVVTLSGYSLVAYGYVTVKFINAVPASSTMNINNQGAKEIHYRSAAIPAGVIKAGDTATFIYDGTRYQLVGIDSNINFVILTQTLTAGSTSVTFTGLPTTGTNLFDIYTSIPWVDYEELSGNASGTLTITYEAQETDMTVFLKIERY